MYVLQPMSGDHALRILEDLLIQLSDMNPEDMTTFELTILHRVAVNPPDKHVGIDSHHQEW